MASAAVHRSHLAPVLLRAYLKRGGDPAPILARFAWGDDAVRATAISLTFEELRALGDLLAELLGDRAFGLHTAQALPRGQYGLLEYVALNARTLREAAALMVRHEQPLTEVGHLSAEELRGKLMVEYEIEGEREGAGRQGNELCLALLMLLARRLSGLDVSAERVWFAHADPSDAGALSAFFGCDQIETGRGKSGMALDGKILDLPVRGAEAALQALLMESADRAPLDSPSGIFSDRVRANIRSELGSNTSLLEKVASRLRMAPRSLQRRLQGEGRSFQDLVDEVRTEMSCTYLHDPELSIRQIALRVGYSEVGPFARAFRRWTGKSPTGWRQSS